MGLRRVSGWGRLVGWFSLSLVQVGLGYSDFCLESSSSRGLRNWHCHVWGLRVCLGLGWGVAQIGAAAVYFH